KRKYIEPAKKIIKSLKDYAITEQQYDGDLKKQLPIIKKLIDITREFSNKLEIKKNELNILEFSDLLLKTLDMLINSSDEEPKLTSFGEDMSKRFKEVLVDEFQDVNQAQDMLFRVLSNNNKNIFMVGDLKQSIYRFREADLDVFLKHRSSCIKQGGDGKFIQLNNNFRSRKEVTNAVNFLFGQIMSAQFGGVDYKDCEQLFSSGIFAENSNFNTEFHILNNDSDLTDLEYEVKHIANTIKSMLLNGFKVSDGKSLRPCKPSDFAILLRSGKKASNLLLKQLRELDVPVKSEVETGYFDAYEVSLVVSLLQIIDNPLLDIPLCTVLLSPMFGFTPDELAQIRLEQKDMPLYLSLKEASNENSKSFINILTQFRKKAASLPLSQLIQEIYNHTLFYSLFANSKSSEQKLANLRLLLSQTEKYENSSSYGLSGFLRMIKHFKENGKGFETFSTVSQNINS
ncbi:MAG: UvrD-helicase domain-containing protein, partial [Oscillospiraceae bacterium]|nr:UvrD-helicase domain-containing protein [Oscillospiraceae bacterium]